MRDSPGHQQWVPLLSRLDKCDRFLSPCHFSFFFFNDTATTEIYTLSLHDALPISRPRRAGCSPPSSRGPRPRRAGARSEEHTSELQSQSNLVCRLLLEKKKKKTCQPSYPTPSSQVDAVPADQLTPAGDLHSHSRAL